MFAERLKQLRKEHGLTQIQLAAIINVERSSVGKYEGKSKVIPSDDVKRRIAEYFDVSVDYLLGLTDIRNAEKREKPADSGSELDEKIISALVDLTPAETLRVLDFVSGIKASRKE